MLTTESILVKVNGKNVSPTWHHLPDSSLPWSGKPRSSAMTTHQDIGQMDMYVRRYDDIKRVAGDNVSVFNRC